MVNRHKPTSYPKNNSNLNILFKFKNKISIKISQFRDIKFVCDRNDNIEMQRMHRII